MSPDKYLVRAIKTHQLHIRLGGSWHKVIVEENVLLKEFYDPWEYAHSSYPTILGSLRDYLVDWVFMKRKELESQRTTFEALHRSFHLQDK